MGLRGKFTLKAIKFVNTFPLECFCAGKRVKGARVIDGVKSLKMDLGLIRLLPHIRSEENVPTDVRHHWEP